MSVFIVAILMALWLTHNRAAKHYGLAIISGTIFIVILYGVSRFIGVEIAGVSAALFFMVTSIMASHVYLHRPLYYPRSTWPYALLLGIILLMKAINQLFSLDQLFIIQGQQISWKILASPGIALIIINGLLALKLSNQAIYKSYAKRTIKPLVTIFLFLFMSQILVKAGFMNSIVQTLHSFDTGWLAVVVAVFGGISGYLTGSATGGNAIMMPAIANISPSETLLPILAAIQNSATGHAALGSLSMVVLIISIAGGNPQEEQRLIRFALGLVIANVAMIAIVGYGLVKIYA